jgi:hypothetical protein
LLSQYCRDIILRSTGFFSALSVSFALLFPEVSLAQVGGERGSGPWVSSIQGGALHQFETDLSDAEGDFSLSRVFVQPSVGYAWNKRNMVSLSLGIGDSDYDFSPEATIDGWQPWGRVRDYKVAIAFRFSPSEHTDAIIIPSVRSYAEEDASLDDGRSEGLLAGVGWKLSDTLTIGPGFGWYTELGGGAHAFPIIILDWAITDKLSLTTGRGLAASQGPGLDLTYSLNDKWQVALAGRYEKTRFALEDDGVTPDGFGQDKSLPLVLSVQYSPWPMTSFSAFIGIEFEGELSLENADGRTVARSEYDTAGAVGLAFRNRF